MKKILLGVTIALLALTGVITYAVVKDTTPTTTIAQTNPETTTEPNPPTVKELLKLVNAERKKVGVAPLKIDKRLNKSAQYKANDFLKDGYYDHTNPKTGESARDIIPGYELGCQNAYENIDAALTSKEAVREWVESPKHYETMIDPTNDVTGFGISNQGDYYYVVEHFCNI